MLQRHRGEPHEENATNTASNAASTSVAGELSFYLLKLIIYLLCTCQMNLSLRLVNPKVARIITFLQGEVCGCSNIV